MSFEVRAARRLGTRAITADFASGPGLTALFGPSGAGKTTVLNMVAGLVRPDSGRILVGGTCLFDADAGIDLPPQARRAGYVFQDGRLFPHMRVEGNLLYGQRRGAGDDAMTLDAACDFLGIGHLLARWPRTLSGGEAQRVAIGRALLSGPRFLLMDEPLASLDAERRQGIMDVIERLRDEARPPILYVSHDQSEVDRLAAAVVPMA